VLNTEPLPTLEKHNIHKHKVQIQITTHYSVTYYTWIRRKNHSVSGVPQYCCILWRKHDTERHPGDSYWFQKEMNLM